MTTAAPVLYESKGSPNARRVRIFIAEKGLDIPTKPVDLGAKEQFSDAFRAINPRSQVPALALTDGPVIAEVLAIWRYLEEAYPQTLLLGTTPTSKALVTMWERRAERSLGRMLTESPNGITFRHLRVDVLVQKCLRARAVQRCPR